MQEKILELFIYERCTPYEIHTQLGCSIKQVYHHLKQYEETIRGYKDGSKRKERHT